MGAEAVDRPVRQVPRHDAATDALLVHDQVEGEILDKELGVVAQRLLVERMDDRVAGAVGGGAGAVGRGALAVLHHVAAERALVDLPGFGARERHAEMFQFDDRRDRLAAHVLDRVLVAQPVRPLDRVVHVPAPIVIAHIGKGGADPALGRHGVAAGREHLRNAGGLQPFEGGAQGRPQAGAAGADDDDIVFVIGDRIGGRHRSYVLLRCEGRALARRRARV